MKAILLIAGLLGACHDAAANLASDTFHTIGMENYFGIALEFPEPGFDIIAAEPLSEEQIQRVIQPASQPEPMRVDAWAARRPKPESAEPESSSPVLWWLVLSTVLCLVCGSWLSAVGWHGKPPRQRRRVKTTIRMMAAC